VCEGVRFAKLSVTVPHLLWSLPNKMLATSSVVLETKTKTIVKTVLVC